ncbi:hypothetical protein KZX45_16485, partial [Georgenia sp. EYE_87]|uniref:hypothetical protein n=1 Tax=Georgenia sp. EYE_87 TaxID=2853448 RepID=UPI00200364DF
GSVGHVEVFRMGGVRTSIFGRPRPLSGDRRADPHYTLNCEEPHYLLGPRFFWEKSPEAGYQAAQNLAMAAVQLNLALGYGFKPERRREDDEPEGHFYLPDWVARETDDCLVYIDPEFVDGQRKHRP